MKKLSDYKGDEAIDLFADLIEPISDIMADPKIATIARSGSAPMILAKEILKLHKNDMLTILLRIDDTPIDGVNVMSRVLGLLLEIGYAGGTSSFFGSAVPKSENESSGFATETTEADAM